MLIGGNRDFNKMRLKSELAPGAKKAQFKIYHLADKDKNVNASANCMPAWNDGDTPGARLANENYMASFGASAEKLRIGLVNMGMLGKQPEPPGTYEKTAEVIRDTLLHPTKP